MIVDELMLKLGVDQSQVAPGLEQFKNKVTDAAGQGHKSFVKVGSEARSFKKLLEEISVQSPMLGTALKFAINPIIGVLAGATLAFGYFRKKIEETNAELDKMGEHNAESAIVKIKDAIHAANMEASKSAGMVVQATPAQQRSKLVNAEVESAKNEFEFRQKTLADLEKKYPKAFDTTTSAAGYSWRQDQRDEIQNARDVLEASKANFEKAQSAQLKYAAEEGAVKIAADAEKLLSETAKKLQEEQDKLEKLQTQEVGIKEESRRQEMTLSEKIISLTEDKLKLAREIDDLEGDTLKQAEKRVELAKKESEIGKAKRDLEKESFSGVNLGGFLSGIVNTAAALGKGMESLQDRYKPTVEQLAKQGQWVYNRKLHRSFWQPGRMAGLAQDIQGLERQAFNQYSIGDREGGDETVGRVSKLRQQLERAGIIKRDLTDVIANAIDHGGLPVNIIGGAE